MNCPEDVTKTGNWKKKTENLRKIEKIDDKN